MSEELKKLEELLANDRKIIEENYKEIERLKEINKELGRDYSSANNGYLRLHSIIKEVREYIKVEKVIKEGNTLEQITNYEKKLLGILDKEGK